MKIKKKPEAEIRVMMNDCRDSYAVSARYLSGSNYVSESNLSGSTYKPTGQGTGLGLNLSYDIITKSHGGEIRVESKAGEGTEFIILLPIN